MTYNMYYYYNYYVGTKWIIGSVPLQKYLLYLSPDTKQSDESSAGVADLCSKCIDFNTKRFWLI